jgi:hypothetical protein
VRANLKQQAPAKSDGFVACRKIDLIGSSAAIQFADFALPIASKLLNIVRLLIKTGVHRSAVKV